MDLEIVVTLKEKLFMVRIMRMRSQSASGNGFVEEVRTKRSQALIPSLCGILVYNDKIFFLVVRSVSNGRYTKNRPPFSMGLDVATHRLPVTVSKTHKACDNFRIRDRSLIPKKYAEL